MIRRAARRASGVAALAARRPRLGNLPPRIRRMNCPRCDGPGRLAGVFANGELHACAACGVFFSADGMVCGASELELAPARSAGDEARYIRRLRNSGAPIWMIADIVGRGVEFVRRSLRGNAGDGGP